MNLIRASFWLAIVLAACAVPAHAQLADSQKKLVMRVKRSAVGKGVVDYVASVGEPSAVTARKEQTVGELIVQQCGHVDASYVELLRQSGVPSVPADFNVTSKFAADTQLRLPACLQLPAATTSRPAEAEVWSEVALKRPEHRDQVVGQIRRALGSSGPQALVENTSEITLYSNLSRADLDSFGACKLQDEPGSSLPIAPPFDPVELLQVLTYNLSMLPSTQRGMPVTIVIPDTGLQYDGKLPFPSHRVDRIGWTGNKRALLEGITPHLDQMHHQHGTSVASAALGGPAFMQLLDALELKLRLAPYNTLSAQGISCGDGASKCPQVRAAVFNNAVDVADNINAIVNLSVGRSTPFPEIERALTDVSDVLFVVAAGNERDQLNNRRVYPASYGGHSNKGQYNLITVAATDLDGTRAAFSNYGKLYIDIAAPGCMQPVLERDPATGENRIVAASGTSFAAPLVSFTAALLRSIWPHSSPRLIKRRILSSADISPHLSPDEVAESRMLNVVNALSIYQDVVVYSGIDGKPHRLRGTIDDGHELFDFCKSLSLYRARGPNQNVVRKIARVTRPGEPESLLIDWENYNGVFQSTPCALHELPQELNIGVTDAFTNKHYQIDGRNLVDVVFAETRQ